jgi:VanZ family protein
VTGILPPGSPSRAWVAVAVWTALTVALSTLPAGAVQPSVPDADKIGHAAVYGVLAFLCARAWSLHGSAHAAAVERSLAMALVLGALMEWVQGHIGRDMSLGDWFADGAGALIGLVFWKAWRIVAGSSPERWR